MIILIFIIKQVTVDVMLYIFTMLRLMVVDELRKIKFNQEEEEARAQEEEARAWEEEARKEEAWNIIN